MFFGRNGEKFHNDRFVELVQLDKAKVESLASKTINLDDACAYRILKTKVDELFWFGRHQNIRVIYLAHYAKDILPVVRENCLKLHYKKSPR